VLHKAFKTVAHDPGHEPVPFGLVQFVHVIAELFYGPPSLAHRLAIVFPSPARDQTLARPLFYRPVLWRFVVPHNLVSPVLIGTDWQTSSLAGFICGASERQQRAPVNASA